MSTPKPNLFDLTGKVALVTGAASGLGMRMCQTLAAAGAAVAAADLNNEGAARTAESIARAGATAIPLFLDVTKPDSARAAVQQTVDRFGRLDIGVNAAGVAGGRPGDEDPISIWRNVIDVDLSGVYYCCLAYADAMRAQHGGSIINIASMSATIVNHFPTPPVAPSRSSGLPGYCAAKAGVKQLTKVLAAHWASSKIRVNCISPGYMATEMTREIFDMPEVINRIHSETPLQRVGRPEDLDGLIVYLASNASDFMTGSELLIDGGYTVW